MRTNKLFRIIDLHRNSWRRRGASIWHVRNFDQLGKYRDRSRSLRRRAGCCLLIRVANQWDKAVVLRLGRFHALNGPGLFFIIPVIDVVAYWIDTRVITSSFKAEKTLTKDTVPVNVDAVLFWKVLDPKKAALDVADYQSAISWASQTALRDVIGKTMLSDMLEGRDKISNELQKIIDERTEPWGINVISVEVKDVLIPPALEDAMSMQAQAERERQARVILEIRSGRWRKSLQKQRRPIPTIRPLYI